MKVLHVYEDPEGGVVAIWTEAYTGPLVMNPKFIFSAFGSGYAPFARSPMRTADQKMEAAERFFRKKEIQANLHHCPAYYGKICSVCEASKEKK